MSLAPLGEDGAGLRCEASRRRSGDAAAAAVADIMSKATPAVDIVLLWQNC